VISVERVAKSKIGKVRCRVLGLTISPPNFLIFWERTFPLEFSEKKLARNLGLVPHHNFLQTAFAASIKEFRRVRIRSDVRLGIIGDGETLIWKEQWFGGVWMLEFEKQHRCIAWHTDAAAVGSVVSFNVHAGKFIIGHVVLHAMEFLQDTEEVVEVFQAKVLDTKVVYNETELDGSPFMASETRC
jgi:hypothetical protein